MACMSMVDLPTAGFPDRKRPYVPPVQSKVRANRLARIAAIPNNFSLCGT